MKINLNHLSLLALSGFLSLSYSNCSNVDFASTQTEKSKSVTDAEPASPAPVICDPFAVGNTISPIAGLKGSIYYLDSSQTRYTRSQDYIDNGHRVPADLFLSQVNVPTRSFTEGFTTTDGSTLKNEADETLFEYFALSLKTKFKLGAGDEPGNYEIGLMSDDGSTVLFDQGRGFETFLEHEGDHSTKMKCSGKTISMTPQSRLPAAITYYQGPRTHIAMVLMWRRVEAGTTPDTVECDKSGNEYFFAPDANGSSVPQDPYKRLLAAGWKPMKADNFELVAGSNKCY